MADERVLFSDNPYTVGSGFMRVRKDGEAQWEDFVNITSFNLNMTTDKLEHFSSRSGAKIRDKSINRQTTAGGTIDVDVPLIGNIKNFFLSDTETAVSQSSGSLTDFAAVVNYDKWTHLGKFNITSGTVVVQDDGDVTTYVEGTDYVIDYKEGFIAPLEGGSIGDGDTLHVDCDYGADERTRLDAGEISQIKRHIWFIGHPIDGKKQEVKGYANLIPSGDLALIGEEWQTFQLSVDFIKHADYAELFEYYERAA